MALLVSVYIERVLFLECVSGALYMDTSDKIIAMCCYNNSLISMKVLVAL
jgi:hypothetical protein